MSVGGVSASLSLVLRVVPLVVPVPPMAIVVRPMGLLDRLRRPAESLGEGAGWLGLLVRLGLPLPPPAPRR